MTLKEKLDELKDDDYINIGAKDGSGWIYICTKKTLMDGLEKINEHYHDQTRDNLRQEGKKIRDIPEEIKKQEANIDELLGKLRIAYERLNNLTDRYVSAWKHRDHYKAYLESWVNMADRDVLDSYPLIDRPDGTAIVISGEEVGKFWTLGEVEEYEKAKEKSATFQKKHDPKSTLDDDEILEMFNQGMNAITIAQTMGVNPRTIRNHLKDMGVNLNDKP